MPFLPGGLDDVVLSGEGSSSLHNNKLRKVAPGLSRGLRLPDDDEEEDLDLGIDVANGAAEGHTGGQVCIVQFYKLDIQFNSPLDRWNGFG